MRQGYKIGVNHGLGLSEKHPIIVVFNFPELNLYRAHASDTFVANVCRESVVAIFRIRVRKVDLAR